VADRDHGGIMHGAQVDEVDVAADGGIAPVRLHPAPIHGDVHVGGRDERVHRVLPTILVLPRVLQRQQQPLLRRQEGGRDAGRGVLTGVIPVDGLRGALREAHRLALGLSGVDHPHGLPHVACSANSLMRQSGPDFRRPTVLTTIIRGSSAELCAARSEAYSSSSRAQPTSS
jgi:hypothetical protein